MDLIELGRNDVVSSYLYVNGIVCNFFKCDFVVFGLVVLGVLEFVWIVVWVRVVNDLGIEEL